MWKVGGETTRADDCPADAWLKLIWYGKTPHVEWESQQMQKICLMVNNP
jgi:hypothetical protein